MAYSVQGKHVLVTGASTGIGAALAIGFAQAGATVGICARREPELAEVLAQVQEHAPASRMWTIDLDDLDGLDAFAADVSSELGGLDVLVNNAGIPKRKQLLALTPRIVEDVMRINYLLAGAIDTRVPPRAHRTVGPNREHLVGRGAPRASG